MNENDAKEIKEKIRRKPMKKIIKLTGKVLGTIKDVVEVINRIDPAYSWLFILFP